MIASSRLRNSECFARVAEWWRIALLGLVVVSLAVGALPAPAAGPAPVPEEKRVALVIGIGKYQFAPQLPIRTTTPGA